MPALELKRVQFYSHADESAFFAFARSIKAVRDITGSGDSIILEVASRPSQESLSDLVALFARYRVSGMHQLAQFRSSSNERWFADPAKFWHKRVFRHGTATV